MACVSYFTAVLGRKGSSWRALDLDLEDVEDLDDVASELRAVSTGGPVLAVLEREDEWFALLLVEDDVSDLRAFVSDLDSAERSRYGELLAPVGDLDVDGYADLVGAAPPVAAADSVGGRSDVPAADDVPADEGPQTLTEDDVDPLLLGAEADLAAAAVETLTVPTWAGDPGLLSDVGVGAVELVAWVEAAPSDPASVLADLGERCGFDDLLDALR
jgi:putative tRNA adenosine deaminase-associated protein